MSIDWFDVEAVKAVVNNKVDDIAQVEAAYNVIKAIAALPEPHCYICGKAGEPGAEHDPDSPSCAHLYTEAINLRRIWLVAKEVVGE